MHLVDLVAEAAGAKESMSLREVSEGFVALTKASGEKRPFTKDEAVAAVKKA